MCSGTKPLEEASADLDYIATIPSAEPTGRVYGTVERMVLIQPIDQLRRAFPRQTCGSRSSMEGIA